MATNRKPELPENLRFAWVLAILLGGICAGLGSIVASHTGNVIYVAVGVGTGIVLGLALGAGLADRMPSTGALRLGRVGAKGAACVAFLLSGTGLLVLLVTGRSIGLTAAIFFGFCGLTCLMIVRRFR